MLLLFGQLSPGRILFSLFCEALIFLIPKLDKDFTGELDQYPLCVQTQQFPTKYLEAEFSHI